MASTQFQMYTINGYAIRTTLFHHQYPTACPDSPFPTAVIVDQCGAGVAVTRFGESGGSDERARQTFLRIFGRCGNGSHRCNAGTAAAAARARAQNISHERASVVVLLRWETEAAFSDEET